MYEQTFLEKLNRKFGRFAIRNLMAIIVCGMAAVFLLDLYLTYEKGIEELLRHDPDVILIGETRNAYTARMVIRAALTGHMVFTTLHAKNALESLHRLLDFGLSEYDLKNTLTAVISQRLYKTKDIFRKECVYEYTRF